jgi:hypothetical protein
MSEHTKRDLEKRLNELDGGDEPPDLALAWRADLRGYYADEELSAAEREAIDYWFSDLEGTEE